MSVQQQAQAEGDDGVARVGWRAMAGPGDVSWGWLAASSSRVARWPRRRRPSGSGSCRRGTSKAVAPMVWTSSTWSAGTARRPHHRGRSLTGVGVAPAPVAPAADGAVHLHPGAGHLFADRGDPDVDAASAELMLGRVLAFPARISPADPVDAR